MLSRPAQVRDLPHEVAFVVRELGPESEYLLSDDPSDPTENRKTHPHDEDDRHNATRPQAPEADPFEGAHDGAEQERQQPGQGDGDDHPLPPVERGEDGKNGGASQIRSEIPRYASDVQGSGHGCDRPLGFLVCRTGSVSSAASDHEESSVLGFGSPYATLVPIAVRGDKPHLRAVDARDVSRDSGPGAFYRVVPSRIPCVVRGQPRTPFQFLPRTGARKLPRLCIPPDSRHGGFMAR